MPRRWLVALLVCLFWTNEMQQFDFNTAQQPYPGTVGATAHAKPVPPPAEPAAREAQREQRRSPRFPFDSLVRVTAVHAGNETRLWGRSTDLCPEGIGVTVIGELKPDW